MINVLHSSLTYYGARVPFTKWLVLAIETRKQRADLAKLDADQLHDIGVSPAQAQAESQRPLWDVPPTWRCD